MQTERSLPAPKSLSNSIRVQLRVIGALMIREAMARYGHESLGFFWLMGEPMLLTCGVAALWSMTGQTHGTGISVIPFALTGYSTITLWRYLIFRSMRAMRSNAGLLFHAHVRFLDILIARSVLDTIGILTAFFIAYVPLSLLGYMQPISDPLLLFGGWFLTAWFTFGVSLFIAAITELNDAVDRFIHPVMYLTLPLTGTFYMVYWLPEKIRYIVLWSPLVHASEMFRAGVFPADIPTNWDVFYLLWWCVGLTAIGLPLLLYAQRHVNFE